MGGNFIMQHTTEALQALGLRDINPGTWSGSRGWSTHTGGAIIDSINPATGQRLAQVRGPTPQDYEDVMASPVAAAAAWRLLPDPKRGDAKQICNRVVERHALPGILQIFIDGGAELAPRVGADRRVALVSFAGWTHVGRQIGVRVAERLGKSLLELGGNNAIIVDETANLDLAVPGIVFGAGGTAGQRCTTTRRRLVHRSRAARLERPPIRAVVQGPTGAP